MKAGHYRMIIAIACAAALGIVALRGDRVRSAEGAEHRVKLSSGVEASGVIMKLVPAGYLVQGSDRCLLFTGDELDSIDGKQPSPPEVPASGSTPLSMETLEDVQPDGAVESRNLFRFRNAGPAILSELKWGIAAHEIDQLQDYRVLDEFGIPQPVRVEDDPSIHGKRVTVTLVRPVLPGEDVRVTTVIRAPTVLRRGNDHVYRTEGDYPDPRLVTRSVLLPKGARIVSVAPEPVLQSASGERPLVVWRRYFVTGERTPWEIRYRL